MCQIGKFRKSLLIYRPKLEFLLHFLLHSVPHDPLQPLAPLFDIILEFQKLGFKRRRHFLLLKSPRFLSLRLSVVRTRNLDPLEIMRIHLFLQGLKIEVVLGWGIREKVSWRFLIVFILWRNHDGLSELFFGHWFPLEQHFQRRQRRLFLLYFLLQM